MQRGFLSGKKTYITAVLAILAGWAGFAVGEPVLGQDALTFADALQMTAIGLIGAFLRSGVEASK